MKFKTMPFYLGLMAVVLGSTLTLSSVWADEDEGDEDDGGEEIATTVDMNSRPLFASDADRVIIPEPDMVSYDDDPEGPEVPPPPGDED